MNDNLINDDSLLAMSWKEQVMHLAAHNAEERIIRALIRTKPESEWEQLIDEHTPQVVHDALDVLYWEKDAITHHHEIKEQPKYRPVDEVIQDYLGKGKRQAARKELQVRLPYLTANEQKQILYAFLNSDAKLDRAFACKYLDGHYEPMYQTAIETIWHLHHDYEAAKVLTHYATDKFIAEHFEQLANDYRYLPVRLRMPADYPVDRSRLEAHELISLCARQHLPLTHQEAFAILSNTIIQQLIREYIAFEGCSLYRLTYVRSILWALGELGFQDIIIRFYIENERTKPLFRQGNNDDVSWTIRDQIYQDGFYYYGDFLHTKDDIENHENL